MTVTAAATPSLRQRAIRGVLWQGLARGGDRAARLLTNIILARFLTPADFGLMGVVAAALAPLDAVTFMATSQAIIQNPNSRRREFLETTFWLTACRGLLIGLLCLAVAPVAAWYFQRPDALPLFCVMALHPVLQGLASPRAQLLVKDMRFGVWSTYQLLTSVLGMAGSILLALWLRSAWALLIGQLLTVAAQTIGSYVIAPLWPRWRFDRAAWREIRGFALQAAGTPVLLMLVFQAPAFILGRVAGLQALGVFVLAHRLLDIPSDIAHQVVGSVAMPAYSEVQHDNDRLRRLWLRALTVVVFMSAVIGVGTAWIGPSLTTVLYGPSYDVSHTLIALLAAAGVLRAISATTGPLFWAMGIPSYDRWAQIGRAVAIYALGPVLALRLGGVGMAAACAAALVVAVTLTMLFAARVTTLRGSDLVEPARRGLLAGALMLLALLAVDRFVELQGGLRLAAGAMAIGFGLGVAQLDSVWRWYARRCAPIA